MLTNSLNDNNRPCRVLARCRPLTTKQTQNSNPNLREKIIRRHQNTLYVYEPQLSQSNPTQFNFDKVFLESDSNIDVFQEVESVIEDLLKGYNTAIMAYGMTGAGKSFTMFGGQQEQGIVSMILGYLLGVDGLKVRLSLLELYNQQLRDLLVENSQNLQIMQDSQGNIIVNDLSWHSLTCAQTLQEILKIGTSKRVTASTASNSQSSRSHCITQVQIQQHTNQKIISSKLFLIDLAGSQRATQNKGLRLQQGANINKSLLSLSNCIIQLSQNSQFVPYRDSKLTRLLKVTLGGNSKSVIIACISPSYLSYDETLNTLKYASKAARIRRQVVPNIKNQDKSELQFLRKQVSKLRELLKDKDKQRQKQNNRAPSPLARRDSSLWKTPKKISPASTKHKNKLERQNQILKVTLKERQNEIKQKDEMIKRLSKEVQFLRRDDRELKDSKENIIPSPNQSKIRRVDIKRPEIPSLQLAREKTRQFKNKIKDLCTEYQSLTKRNKLPSSLIETINQLSQQLQSSQGTIVLNQQYLVILSELKKLADISNN